MTSLKVFSEITDNPADPGRERLSTLLQVHLRSLYSGKPHHAATYLQSNRSSNELITHSYRNKTYQPRNLYQLQEIYASFIIWMKLSCSHGSIARLARAQEFLIALLFSIFSQPNVAILWNQYKPLNRMRRVFWSSNTRMYFLHQGLLPGSISLDRCGQMAESELMDNYDNTEQYSPTEIAKTVEYLAFISENEVSRKHQQEKKEVHRLLTTRQSLQRKTIFYAGSNDYESGIYPRFCRRSRIHSPYYSSTIDALVSLCIVAQDLEVDILFKPHPLVSYPKATINRLESLTNLITVSDANLFECIKLTDGTATLVSQCGYHALALGKPVLSMGVNPLNISGAAYTLKGPNDLSLSLQALIRYGISDAMHASWIHHVTFLRKRYLFSYWSGYEEYFDHCLDDLVSKIV